MKQTKRKDTIVQRRSFQPLHPPTTTVQTADHDVLVLADNLRIHPDLLIGNGNGIFGSGVQGTGKTGILCRILEQAAQFHVPMVVFDREGDLAPAAQLFPKGFVGTRENCPGARDVLGSGLQVVYDLSTWHSMNDTKARSSQE